MAGAFSGRTRLVAVQGVMAAAAGALQAEKSIAVVAFVWPIELMVVPALALAVALFASMLPAWEAYRVSVFELLQSR